MPDYTPGEFFMFDSGAVYTVTGHDQGLVLWESNFQSTHRAHRNFVIPDLSWTNRTGSSEGRTTAIPTALWPLKVGNTATIPFSQVVQFNDGSKPPLTIERNWQCSVVDTARISVTAGTFDTFKIECTRNSPISGRWRATRTFYYAPEVGYYVLREDQHRYDGNSKKQLLTYGFNSAYLTEEEKQALRGTLNRALTDNPRGEADTWSSASGKVTAMLVPTDTLGNACREYRSIYNVNGRIGRPNTRTMCSDGPVGTWTREK
ncbi:MAG: hypothetical protein B0D85_03140 [Candidatus Sedimenticola endophacoides]|nr:MAG: hypothetical protein B0D85_03140 [Candidatus Sedimenticola endophacoides]